jgi:hypothetical protein
MLKHRSCYKVYAETRKLLHKPEDAHAETRAATQPRMHMPKHEAVTWFEVEDAETELSLSSEQMLRHSGTATMLKHEP